MISQVSKLLTISFFDLFEARKFCRIAGIESNFSIIVTQYAVIEHKLKGSTQI